MGPVKRLAVLSTLAALAAPASALGAQTTVDPAGSGTCAQGGVCKTIGAAIAVSQPDDKLIVKAGGYTENVVVPAELGNLEIDAEAGAALSGSLVVDAPGVNVTRLTVARTAGSEPAITAGGGTFELRDALVVSTGGTAVSVIGGAGNLVQRSTLASTATAGEGDGLRLTSSTAGAKALQVDSSILIGGAGGGGGTGGAAMRVVTSGTGADAALTLNHVTAVSANGLVLDGSGGSSAVVAPGDIAATVNSSIVHGTSFAAEYAPLGLPIPLPGNNVSATYANSDANPMVAASGSPEIDMGGATKTPDSQLFTKNLRLKFGSPAIDKGGAVAGGESTTDVDAEPRVNGGASDIGADEFVNVKPTVTFTVEPSPLAKNAEATFTAKAADGNGGDDIIGYAFDYGDGSKVEQTTSHVARHTYATEGRFTAKVAVADRSGAISEVATETVIVGDGSSPVVRITSPVYDRRMVLGRKRLKVRGTASDVSGVAKVQIAVTRILANGCSHYTGSGFRKAACTSYRFRAAKLSGNDFSYKTKKGLRIKKGIYEIRARGTDKLGNVTTIFSKHSNLVRFPVR